LGFDLKWINMPLQFFGPPLIFHQIGLHELIELFGQGYGFSDSPEHPYTFVCHYGLAIFDNG
jgi:hypothetical protein